MSLNLIRYEQRNLRFGMFVMALCFLVSGCGRKHHRVAAVPQPPRPSQSQSERHSAVAVGYTEEGIASWYGIPYHGRAAADGEIYDMETLVAAHRVLPFNSWLRVTNEANGKSVNVRVIDRGPFVDGRILDLSKAAAREIDLLGPGIGKVRLEVISAPVQNAAGDLYAVQVGAFSVYENAERLRAQYANRFGSAQLAVKQGKTPLWRVLVGKEPSIGAAQQLASTLAADRKDVFVVRLDPPVAQTATAITDSPQAVQPSVTEPSSPQTPPHDDSQPY